MSNETEVKVVTASPDIAKAEMWRQHMEYIAEEAQRTIKIEFDEGMRPWDTPEITPGIVRHVLQAADAEREAQRLDWRDASIALENAGCIGSSRLEQVQELIAQRDAAVKRMRQLEDEREEREGLRDELEAFCADPDNVEYYDENGDPMCAFCGDVLANGVEHLPGCLHLRARAAREGGDE